MTRLNPGARRTVVAAAVVTVLVVSGCNADQSQPDPDRAGEAIATASPQVDGPQGVIPCDDTERAVAEVLNTSHYEIGLPTDGVVTEKQIDAAYLCPGGGSYLTFTSGATLQVRVSDLRDPSATWSALAHQDPDVYEVRENQGVSALFIQPGGGTYQDAEGGVTFVKDGLYVAVGGNTVLPLEDLAEAAAAVWITPVEAAK